MPLLGNKSSVDEVGNSCAQVFLNNERDGSSVYSGQFSLFRASEEDRLSLVLGPGWSDSRGCPDELVFVGDETTLDVEEDRRPSFGSFVDAGLDAGLVSEDTFREAPALGPFADDLDSGRRKRDDGEPRDEDIFSFSRAASSPSLR